MGPLMGVQPKSGSTDPGAAVTRPDSDMTAGLHTVLAGCTLAFESCNTYVFLRTCQSLGDTPYARMIDSVRRCLAGSGSTPLDVNLESVLVP